MQQKSRENRESRKQMKSNNSLYEHLLGFKNRFPPYKNRKNKTSFGKNSFGENLGGEDK